MIAKNTVTGLILITKSCCNEVSSRTHMCSCLPVIVSMVMEQCVARLDIAMFNAILWESSYELIPYPILL
ncbi:hypothetical protein E1A91_A11G348700v1 [Gossypium mustelinum]|uniref:Uncharacterized protein n=1 Tax=Gossypium mustelinum TaxID=34275 RepID=A0A5D2XHR3_GOSMU|nr:hypothetical protein E1A91_A11G348700v1 [Gossypium mustelinum]